MKMKKLIKAVALAVCLTMTAPVVAPSVGIETVEAATKVKLNYSKRTIYEGDSFKLKITGTNKKVKWVSSSKKVATVSSKGVVEGINKGSAKITASVGGKKYSCKVTVKEFEEYEDEYEDENFNDNVNDTQPIEYSYDDCNKYEKMGVDGLVNLYPLLKDPSSLVIHSISYGVSSDFIQPLECVVIDYNATNSYGGSVRGYCMVWYSLTNKECFKADCSSVSMSKYITVGVLDKDKLFSIAEKYFY